MLLVDAISFLRMFSEDEYKRSSKWAILGSDMPANNLWHCSSADMANIILDVHYDICYLWRVDIYIYFIWQNPNTNVTNMLTMVMTTA